MVVSRFVTNGDNEDGFASLTEKAYQAISGAIANLELKPGEPLTQDRLAKWLQISRTPVREALRLLEQDGIIQNVPGRGLVVAEFTVKDVEDMLEMLRLLDGQAAYLAAQRRSADAARRMVEIAHALLGPAEQGDTKAWSLADKPYHELMLDAAGNRLLRQSILDIRRRLHRITISSSTRPSRLLVCTHEHIAIAEAIMSGDAGAAASCMQQHIDAMRESTMELINGYLVPSRGARF